MENTRMCGHGKSRGYQEVWFQADWCSGGRNLGQHPGAWTERVAVVTRKVRGLLFSVVAGRE